MRSVLGELLAGGDGGGDVVVDMEAGLEHLSRGTTRHVDVLLAVAEPYFRSMETARRVCDLGHELGIPRVRLLPNKVRDVADATALAEFAQRHGLEACDAVPFDDAVLQADRAARAVLDVAAPDAPVVRRLDALARELADGGI